MKIVSTLLAALSAMTLAGTAFAHTTIIKSNIQAGAAKTEAPAMFEFSFVDDVGLAALDLETLSGERVDIGFERPSAKGRDFSVPLPAIGPGDYVLKWRAIAKDGHVMRGEIAFSILG